MAGFTRRDLLRIISGVAVFANPLSAQASQTPTLKCTRLGQQIIWKNKKYTCIKSGKKLIWDQGVSIPMATPSASSSPTASAATQKPATPLYTPPPQEFAVAKSSDLKMNQPISVANPSLSQPSRGYILVRRENAVVAFTNNCTHEGSEIEVSKSQLICFRHMSIFDSEDGHVISGPATRTLKLFETKERDGQVFVIDTP
jgi:nitrite reductase/ring-hydroxylating ferredoxin subunit